ncbi:MAG: hypothetical protein S4CHLAM81_14240 [Chlamydiales bacterium]|nr:hypothetical protein [Chlamydiales bacterium]
MSTESVGGNSESYRVALSVAALTAITAVALAVLNLTPYLDLELNAAACYAIIGVGAAATAISVSALVKSKATATTASPEQSGDSSWVTPVIGSGTNPKRTEVLPKMQGFGYEQQALDEALTLTEIQRRAKQALMDSTAFSSVTFIHLYADNGPKFRYISQGLGQLERLQGIDMTDHNLVNLEVEGDWKERIRYLNLNRNRGIALGGIEGFVSLQTLQLGNCGLQDITEVLALNTLQELTLSGNRIAWGQQAFTNEFVQGLHMLKVAYTELQWVPNQFAQLRDLWTLDLSNNQLQGLPPFLGELSQLRSLNLSNNEGLQITAQLEQCLGQLRNLRDLNIEGTAITPAQRDRILAACRQARMPQFAPPPPIINPVRARRANMVAVAARRQGALLTKEHLITEIKDWKRDLQNSPESLNGDVRSLLTQMESIQLEEQLDEMQVNVLARWLPRLRGAAQYKKTECRPGFVLSICKVLVAMNQYPDLRDFVLGVASNDLVGCGDRAIGSLSSIWPEYLLTTLDDTDLQEVIRTILATGRFNKLREVALRCTEAERERAGFINPHNEMVEIYVWLDLQMKERLHLMLPYSTMLYPSIGRAQWFQGTANQDRIANEVLQVPAREILFATDLATGYSSWMTFLHKKSRWGGLITQFQELADAVIGKMADDDKIDFTNKERGSEHLTAKINKMHADFLAKTKERDVVLTASGKQKVEELFINHVRKAILNAYKALDCDDKDERTVIDELVGNSQIATIIQNYIERKFKVPHVQSGNLKVCWGLEQQSSFIEEFKVSAVQVDFSNSKQATGWVAEELTRQYQEWNKNAGLEQELVRRLGGLLEQRDIQEIEAFEHELDTAQERLSLNPILFEAVKLKLYLAKKGDADTEMRLKTLFRDYLAYARLYTDAVFSKKGDLDALYNEWMGKQGERREKLIHSLGRILTINWQQRDEEVTFAGNMEAALALENGTWNQVAEDRPDPDVVAQLKQTYEQLKESDGGIVDLQAVFTFWEGGERPGVRDRMEIIRAFNVWRTERESVLSDFEKWRTEGDQINEEIEEWRRRCTAMSNRETRQIFDDIMTHAPQRIASLPDLVKGDASNVQKQLIPRVITLLAEEVSQRVLDENGIDLDDVDPCVAEKRRTEEQMRGHREREQREAREASQ